jgi:hypothetical protein
VHDGDGAGAAGELLVRGQRDLTTSAIVKVGGGADGQISLTGTGRRDFVEIDASSRASGW